LGPFSATHQPKKERNNVTVLLWSDVGARGEVKLEKEISRGRRPVVKSHTNTMDGQNHRKAVFTDGSFLLVVGKIIHWSDNSQIDGQIIFFSN